MTSSIKVEGLQGLQDTLTNIAPREAQRLNRATVHALAGEVRDAARLKAPKDTGTLKKAIKSRQGRPKDKDHPFSDVIVHSGKTAKYDAYYWRFVEFGSLGQPEHPFIRPAAMAVRNDVVPMYREHFQRKLEALLKRKAKKAKR